MKKGESRISYDFRKAMENRNSLINRLRSDERFLEVQLANIRRKIAAYEKRPQDV